MAVSSPRRGEIWFVKLPSDPADKLPRPVVVVSIEERNRNERANTILVAPLSTTLRDVPTWIQLSPGETGLREASSLQAENITTVRKEILMAPRTRLRSLSESRLREIAGCVVKALGFLPEELRD